MIYRLMMCSQKCELVMNCFFSGMSLAMTDVVSSENLIQAQLIGGALFGGHESDTPYAST